jgi:hypothetical protein
MADLIYPNLIPNYIRKFGFPVYDEYEQELMGGEYRVSYVTNGIKFTLELEYKNLTAANVQSITDFYNSTLGNFRQFLVPEEIFRHPQVLQNAIDSIIGTVWWKFKEPPNFTTDYVDIYTGKVTLCSVASARLPETTGTFPCQISP